MAADLLILRHGIAEERTPARPDDGRELTEAGRRRTRAVLDHLVGLGLRADRLLASPLARARQTAELAVAAGLAPRLELAEALAPGGDPLPLIGTWLAELAATGGERRRLALVGHEPELGLDRSAQGRRGRPAPAGSGHRGVGGAGPAAAAAGAPSAPGRMLREVAQGGGGGRRLSLRKLTGRGNQRYGAGGSRPPRFPGAHSHRYGRGNPPSGNTRSGWVRQPQHRLRLCRCLPPRSGGGAGHPVGGL
jgi:phosphohistidine phosphatase SixA